MQKVQAWGETRIQTTYFLISSEPDCNIWFLFILVYLDISHADCFPFSELIVGLPMTAFCVFIVIFRPLDKCCGHKRSAKLSNWGSCEILQNISIFFFFRLNKFVCLTKDSAEIICSAGMKEIIFFIHSAHGLLTYPGWTQLPDLCVVLQVRRSSWSRRSSTASSLATPRWRPAAVKPSVPWSRPCSCPRDSPAPTTTSTSGWTVWRRSLTLLSPTPHPPTRRDKRWEESGVVTILILLKTDFQI